MEHADQAVDCPSREDLIGSYFNPGVAASGLRLTLDIAGRVKLEKWLDLGAAWMTVQAGKFTIVGSVLLTSLRGFDWCVTSFAQDGELHARRLRLMRAYDNPELQWRIVLAPSDSVQELDRAVEQNHPELAGLEQSFFGLRLFFHQED
jgi:hypothetical protein